MGDDHDTVIHIYKLHTRVLLNKDEQSLWTQYTNAKVVLVGDSAVGKSGLGLVLTKHPFAATESTHGRHVYTFDTTDFQMGKDRREMRETLLWDLAGQPGYRLIHQLHLKEVTVALICFDGRSETDPFSGVRHWTRALNQAQNMNGTSALPLKKFLVSARNDRGGVSVSKERMETFVAEMGFDGYFETSAKEGWHIQELSTAIRGAIDWEALPRVNSNALFQDIKEFLLAEKEEGHLLSTKEDLYRRFIKSDASVDASDDLKQQFDTCIGRVESRDLIRRLGFGNLVLLQPEMLDSYASAMVDAAKSEPDGLGSIAEDNARNGHFRMSQDEKLQDKEQEKLLLISTIEDMLAHEIALREVSADGVQLVFPSQFMRENPALPDPEGQTVIFAFSGAVFNVYATLAVRLSHSGLFRKKQMWRNAATFEAGAGGTCGVFLRSIEEGSAEITLFFEATVSEQTKYEFEEYIHAHILRRAISDSVQRRRVFQCSGCQQTIPDKQTTARRLRGFSSMVCPICDVVISLLEDRSFVTLRQDSVQQMNEAADEQRKRAIAASVLEGKIATDDFDTFLAHNSEDKDQIEIISGQLKSRGLYPWLDKEQVPPGKPFQDHLQEIIPIIKSAIIFVGPHGIGPWEKVEIRAMVTQFVERGIPVIPVLLPGVDDFPKELLFLKELNYVSFSKGIQDTDAMDRLQWGITQQRPGHMVSSNV